MSKGRILVVDDNPNLLELIRMRLESAEFEVMATADEEQATQALKEQLFDLCIVDLMLANGDGLTLMDEFRSINPDVPTIILTAHGSIENAVEAMRRGAYSLCDQAFRTGGSIAADRACAGEPQAQFRNQTAQRDS